LQQLFFFADFFPDDNTGLNDIDLYCCTVQETTQKKKPNDELPDCEPEVKWVKMHDVSNNALSPQSSTYTVTVGVTKQSGTKEASSKTNTKGTDTGYGIGFETGPEWAKVKATFEEKFSESSTKGTESEVSNVDIFQNERSYSQTLNVAPKRRMTITQKIGICGDIQVKTGTYKIDESCMEEFKDCNDSTNDKENGDKETNNILVTRIINLVAVGAPMEGVEHGIGDELTSKSKGESQVSVSSTKGLTYDTHENNNLLIYISYGAFWLVAVVVIVIIYLIITMRKYVDRLSGYSDPVNNIKDKETSGV